MFPSGFRRRAKEGEPVAANGTRKKESGRRRKKPDSEAVTMPSTEMKREKVDYGGTHLSC